MHRSQVHLSPHVLRLQTDVMSQVGPIGEQLTSDELAPRGA